MNIVKEIRSKHNLTQRELAGRLGVSLESVCNWEQNERLPTTNAVFDRLAGLAKAVDMELEKPIRPRRTSKASAKTTCVSDHRLEALLEGEADEATLEALVDLFIWYGDQGKVDPEVLQVAKAIQRKRWKATSSIPPTR